MGRFTLLIADQIKPIGVDVPRRKFFEDLVAEPGIVEPLPLKYKARLGDPYHHLRPTGDRPFVDLGHIVKRTKGDISRAIQRQGPCGRGFTVWQVAKE